MISLRALSDLGGRNTLAHIFSEDELDREYRCLMPYVDVDFVEGRARIWLVVVAYPHVLPKRWFADGRMIGVELSATANSIELSYSHAGTGTCDEETDVVSAEMHPQSMVLATPTSHLSLHRGGVIVSRVIPLGSSYYGPEHVGKQLGKF